MKFYIETFGCKANQADSAALERDLRGRGLHPTPDPSAARLIVVNTCTVTASADQQARQRVRHLRRLNSGALVVVTGCYAERDARALTAMPEVDRVWGNRDKPRLPELLLGDEFCSRLDPRVDDGQEAAAVAAVAPEGRTRAFLKVQDGCALRCSYCIIPGVRGGGRSVPAVVARRQLETLVEAGYLEVVLTGINTGSWGHDLAPRQSLTGLLRELLQVAGLGRLRLNSLEPLTVTRDLVDLMAAEPRLAPHLQVPLQSGSDRVLGRMRRPYRLASYACLLETLRRRLPDMGLGADVIVGFPGESDEDFRATLGYVESSPLTYLHVFPFSPRPGTPAAAFGGQVHGSVIRERSRRLREAAARLGARFRSSFVGRRLDFLVLADGMEGGAARGAPGAQPASFRALSGNYLEADLAWPGGGPNRLVEAEVSGLAAGGRLRARAVREIDLGDDRPRVPNHAAPRFSAALELDAAPAAASGLSIGDRLPMISG